MYSAAIRTSSSVADMPRFSMIGLRSRPAFFNSEKFCMLRAPIWITSAYSATSTRDSSSRASVMIFSPKRSRISADRKSTRLNSSHLEISYAVFCLKKKNDIYSLEDLPQVLHYLKTMNSRATVFVSVPIDPDICGIADGTSMSVAGIESLSSYGDGAAGRWIRLRAVGAQGAVVEAMSGRARFRRSTGQHRVFSGVGSFLLL